MKEENKKRLDEIFQNMRINMSKVDMLSMYAHEIFKKFPENLPKKSLDTFSNDVGLLKKIRNIEEIDFNSLNTEQFCELGFSKDFNRFLTNFGYITQVGGKSDIESIGFEQVLYRQEFISLYSYLEGYFQDIQRLLFENDKSLLSNKDKEIPINDIIQANSYKEVISQIIESKLQKSGYEKISKIIEKWKKEPFRIILKLRKVELTNLDKFTCIRNIIIHNNAKVDSSLMEFLDEKSFKVGDAYNLDSHIMKEYRDLIFEIVLSTYVEISSKYPEIIEIRED